MRWVRPWERAALGGASNAVLAAVEEGFSESRACTMSRRVAEVELRPRIGVPVDQRALDWDLLRVAIAGGPGPFAFYLTAWAEPADVLEAWISTPFGDLEMVLYPDSDDIDRYCTKVSESIRALLDAEMCVRLDANGSVSLSPLPEAAVWGPDNSSIQFACQDGVPFVRWIV